MFKARENLTSIPKMEIKNISKYIALLVSLLLIGIIFYFFSNIIAYVVVAWVLSLLGQPFMKFYKKNIRIKNVFQAGNTACAILTMLTFVIIIGTVVAFFVPTIIQQGGKLAQIDYTTLAKGLEEPINDWNDWFVDLGFVEGKSPEVETEIAADNASTNPENTAPKIHKTTIEIDSVLLANGHNFTQTNITLAIDLNANGNTMADNIALEQIASTPVEKLQKRFFDFFDPSQITVLFSGLIGFFGNLLIALMSILFITFFFLKEQDLFVGFLMAVVPNRHEQKANNAYLGVTHLLTRYFSGIFIQASIITLFVSVGLSLLGIENALLIGIFAAMINVIPYLGPMIGAAFGIFIVISSNLDLDFYSEMMPLIFKVMGVFAGMQMLDNFVLQPVIFSNSVLAHPLEIFIIILIGAQLGGVVGMVLAIPVYTVIRVIAKVFLSEFELVQKITGGINDV